MTCPTSAVLAADRPATTSVEMSALRERLGAAQAFDADLDHAIWRALCWRDHWRDVPVDSRLTADPLKAIALARLVAPGCRIDMSSETNERHSAVILIDERPAGYGRHSSLASAIVEAVLMRAASRAK